jgi:hypothetical protein
LRNGAQIDQKLVELVAILVRGWRPPDRVGREVGGVTPVVQAVSLLVPIENVAGLEEIRIPEDECA